MNVRVITGSKQEIAAEVSRLPGEVREAIVFIDDAATTPAAGASAPAAAFPTADDLFAEMRPHMADVSDGVSVDDSRESIYERREGE